ncbi:MAG: hypothetical protein HON90_18070 [Halobacteriovoraceae bacterium]|jgi:cytochrome c553|nr:hypothetical protein [Halobacteriovoraceae bacterium]
MHYLMATICLSFVLVGCEIVPDSYQKYSSNPIANNNSPGDRTGSGAGEPGTLADDGVYWDSDILPIIIDSCAACHGASDNKNWTDYAMVKIYASDILASIKHETGIKPMPMIGGKMSDDKIALFEEWLDTGMKEINPGVSPETEVPEPSTTPTQTEPQPTEPQEPTEPLPPTSSEDPTSNEVVSWVSDIQPLLKARCISCHKEGMPKDWTDYETVKSASEKILASIKHEDGVMGMPLVGGKLTDEQVNLFQAWIDTGMQESSSVCTPTEPQQQTEPLPQTSSEEPTNEVVNWVLDIQPLLKDRCTNCHNVGMAAKDWTDYELVKAASERILGSIKHENGFMPMPIVGDKFTGEQVSLFQAWVDTGMQESTSVNVLTEPLPEPEPVLTGESIYKKNCFICHDSAAINPRLAGQNKHYLFTQLKDFRDPGKRVDGAMNAQAELHLDTDEKAEMVATYLAELDPCSVPHQVNEIIISQSEPTPDISAGQEVFTSCIGCHSAGNPFNAPTLQGQNSNYLLKALDEFKSGVRPSVFMLGAASGLTRKQMVDVSVYLNSINECKK